MGGVMPNATAQHVPASNAITGEGSGTRDRAIESIGAGRIGIGAADSAGRMPHDVKTCRISRCFMCAAAKEGE